MSIPGRLEPYPGRPPRYAHQNRMANFIVQRDGRGCLFAEPGTGKTRVVLDLVAAYLWRTLIVCPMRLAYGVWPQQLDEWAPDLPPVRNLHERRREGVGKEPVQVVNFEMFKIAVKSGLLKPDQWDLLVVDESSKLKSRQTQITKDLLKFSRGVPRAVCLSGTPAPNTPLEYWAQIEMVAPGHCGRSFYSFRGNWFTPIGYGEWRGKGNNWHLKRELEEPFMAHLGEVALWIRKADCLDLPEKTIQRVMVQLSPAERRAYTSMDTTFWLLMGDESIQARNIITALNKLRQITSGFAYSGQEDAPAHSIGDSKLAAAIEILDSLAGRPVIVVFNYRAEGERLRASLPAGECELLYGGMSGAAGQALIDRWRAGEFRVLALHPASAGHGLTLTEASEMIWMSQTYSLELWEQTCDRLHRPGQKRPVTIYTILAEDTVDLEVQKALEMKQRLSDRMKDLAKTH